MWHIRKDFSFTACSGERSVLKHISKPATALSAAVIVENYIHNKIKVFKVK